MTDMITPIVGTVSPVWAWVTRSTIAQVNVMMLITKPLKDVIADSGRGNLVGSTDAVLSESSFRKAK